MRVVKKFNKQELLDMNLPYDPPEGGKIISDDIEDTSRWSENHSLIVQFPDQVDTDEAWHFSYSRGLTEYQDESPWEYDDEVEGYLVKKIEKVVEVWE